MPAASSRKPKPPSGSSAKKPYKKPGASKPGSGTTVRIPKIPNNVKMTPYGK